MKLKFISIIVMLTLLSIGILGFFWVGSMNHGGISVCPISDLQNGSCAVVGDGVLSMAQHHISWLQQTSEFVLTNTTFELIALLLALVALVFFAFVRLSKKILFNQLIFSFFKRNERSLLFINFKKNLLCWIALLNNINPHSNYRVCVYVKA